MIPSMSLETPSSPPSRGQRRRLLDDPRAIRAMAHPLRLELLSIVGRSGRITAADAARELGISHGLASHHLRQLGKYRFVEQVDGADNRQHPWQLVDTSHSFDGIENKPGGAAAIAVLEQVEAERALENLSDWHERRESWSKQWREHSGVGRSTIYLTQEELADVVGKIDGVLLDYVDRRPLDDLASRPPGSVPVEFTLIVVPREATSSGN